MPCRPTTTAQGSPGASHFDKPRRAPSKETNVSLSRCGPVNPDGGIIGCWKVMPAQPASANAAKLIKSLRIMTPL